jgi:hypothetical protein
MQKEPMVNLVYATLGHVLLLWRCQTNGSHDKLPWGKVRELMVNGDDKEVMLANKVVDLLLYINYILSWRHNQWMSKGC